MDVSGTVSEVCPVTNLTYPTAALSLGWYAVWVGLPVFEPECHAKMVEAFGDRPLGLPLRVVLFAGLTALYLPFPWMIWHLCRVTVQLQRDGGLVPGIGYLLSFHPDPNVRRSKIVCLVGAAYFLAICFAWIIYATVRGI
jgi:hypothetical protein